MDGRSTMWTRFLSMNRLGTEFIFGCVGLEPAHETRVTGDVTTGCEGEGFVHQINAYLAGERVFERRYQRGVDRQFRGLGIELLVQVFCLLREVFGVQRRYKGCGLYLPLFTLEGRRRRSGTTIRL